VYVALGQSDLAKNYVPNLFQWYIIGHEPQTLTPKCVLLNPQAQAQNHKAQVRNRV